jgi:hypothetical protein
MANHVVSLDIPVTMNKCILRIVDTSVYMLTPAPICPQLEVTLPGFTQAVVLGTAQGVSPGFIVNLTGCDLNIQTVNCGTNYCDLPDGIYIIKWSVSPNEIIYVEYNHLRITAALHKVQQILCDLDLGACDPPTDLKDKLNQITLIQRYLDAAVAMVEYCHTPDKGMNLYRYAVKLLDKMLCSTGCGSSSSCSSC